MNKIIGYSCALLAWACFKGCRKQILHAQIRYIGGGGEVYSREEAATAPLARGAAVDFIVLCFCAAGSSFRLVESVVDVQSEQQVG